MKKATLHYHQQHKLQKNLYEIIIYLCMYKKMQKYYILIQEFL